MIIDGAEIIKISKRQDYGVIRYTDNSAPPIPIHYLAIGKYDTSSSIYLFFCDETMEVEQDDTFDTIEEAMKRAEEINKYVEWEDGIKYISFDAIDFKGGEVKFIEGFGEDMLVINYPDNISVDVGYCDSEDAFIITISNDRELTEIVVKTDTEMKNKLIEIITKITEKS